MKKNSKKSPWNNKETMSKTDKVNVILVSVLTTIVFNILFDLLFN